MSADAPSDADRSRTPAPEGPDGRARVLLCGTGFGRFYATAVARTPGLTLAGVLSRGSSSSRNYAASLGVPHYGAVEAIPDEALACVDLACVVIGSTISGGAGSEVARALLARGVPVIQEHPVHPDEMTRTLRIARQRGVQYRVNTHYPQVEPVRAFLAAARALRARSRPLFVDAAGPVHVLLPLVDILGRALGELRPWRFAALDDPATAGPLRGITGELGGVPLTLRVHNQLDPSDRDNHALLWHRIALGTQAGVLTLADTHGPVLWSPQLHADRDADGRMVLDGPGTGHLDEPSTAVLAGTSAARQQDVFERLWPDATARALTEMVAAIRAGDDPLLSAQYDLSVTHIWSRLAAALGPPEIVRPGRPRLVPVSELAAAVASELEPAPTAPLPAPVSKQKAERPAAETGPREPRPYTPTAEFFDLVAAGHVERSSAPAVVEALRAAGLGKGVLVEIGAGTGLLTEAVARAFPQSEIICFEPSDGMRAVLTGRVCRDDDLRSRVTVSADPAPNLDLPETIEAALVCGVAGHLSPGKRAALWGRLRKRLGPGGMIIVELMDLDRPVDLAPHRLARTRLGDQNYEWWLSGQPAGDDTIILRTTWRVLSGDRVVREAHDSYTWQTISLAEVAAEAGLTLHPLPLPEGSSTVLGALTEPRTAG
ncbi:bifunctional Gfo/Idh/MocA family oxidoreductase/class I SAM-dependent methyltransferase [Parafrankia sp. FMc6]|uniref:Gfo/Idh/MocA family oxidoreductase n=1 Tax=Parafrankia soli TaxID=2599596 RepID=UPI0034D68821